MKDKSKYSQIAVYSLIVLGVGTLLVMALFAAGEFIAEKKYTEVLAILNPFIFGFVFAYLLSPLLNFFETRVFRKLIVHRKDVKKEWKFRRVISLIATFLTAVVFIALLALMIFPQVGDSMNQLVVNVADLFSPGSASAPAPAAAAPSAPGNYLDEFGAFINDENAPNDSERVYNYLMTLRIGTVISNTALSIQNFISGFGVEVDIESSVRELFLGAAANITVYFMEYSQTIVDATANFVMGTAKQVMNIIIAIIIAFYILSDKEHLISQVKRLLFALFPERFADRAVSITRNTHKVFGGFILGILFESLIMGVVCFIGMSLLRINYAVLISVIVGITNVIPFFGPFIGAIPSIIFLLIYNPSQALIFAVFILVLQQIEGNIIAPKVIGDNVGLTSFWVIFSILIMNGLLGPVGMFIGVPLFAVIYMLVKDFCENRLTKKGIYIRSTDPAYMMRTGPPSPDAGLRDGSEPAGKDDPFDAPFTKDGFPEEEPPGKKVPEILDKLAKNIHKYIGGDR